jgi:1,4-alpha-glucan branching enzyme
MLSKQDVQGEVAQVTFSLPKEVEGDSACLVGDFNDWDESATPMERDDDGGFSTTIKLEKGREYQFRYLVNGRDWHNDWNADAYVENPFGCDNSIIRT